MGSWGDFADAIDFIGDILDLFGIGGEAGDVAEVAIEPYVIREIGQEGFGIALDLTGNEGQVSIISRMGPESFIEAAFAAASDDDPIGVLFDACSHPEAVGEILEESGSYIADAVEELKS